MMNDDQAEDRLDDLLAQWELAREAGRRLSAGELCRDTPELAPILRQRIDRLRGTSWMLVDQASGDVSGRDTPQLGADDTQTTQSELTVPQFVESIAVSGVLTDDALLRMRQRAVVNDSESVETLAATLVEDGLLTKYQADVILNRENGPLLLDRYIILDTLGSGGMGIVFKALHRAMERIVAIKVLPGYAVNSPEKVQRFHREVVSVAKLSHPNVVSAFDAHESDGTYFLVMEYVDGDNLRDCINESGPLGVEDAVGLIDQVAAGLSAAHTENMVHRDVKPTNIMLTTDGTAKLLDLGLARTMQLAKDADESELTEDGLGMGTASYMSPEQALDAKAVDARSDIYSLGCTLYFLIVGRAPFEFNTTVQTIVAHREIPAPLIGEGRDDVPESVESIFQRMVAKAPGDRYESIDALRNDLAKCMSVDHQIPTFVPSTPHRSLQSESPRKRSGRPQAIWVIAVCAIVLAIVASLWALSGRLPKDDFTLHRDVAKWAIASGGYVTIENELGEYQSEETADLPDGDFKVVGLELYATEAAFSVEPALEILGLRTLALYDFEEVDIPKIAQLHSLSDITFNACTVADSDLAFLSSMPNLRALSLDNCDVTDAGMSALALALKLDTLTIGGTLVSGKGLRFLGPLSNLRLLDLTELEFAAEDLQHLTPDLQELYLASCTVGDEVVDELRRFPDLFAVGLQGTQITSAGVKALASLNNLQILDLSDVDLSAEALSALQQCSSLQELSVMGMKLSEEHYVALLGLTQVHDLNLTRTDLDNAGLMRLIPMQNLQSLSLEDTNVTQRGIDRFFSQRTDVSLYMEFGNP